VLCLWPAQSAARIGGIQRSEGTLRVLHPTRPEHRAIIAQLRTAARTARGNQRGAHKRRSRTLIDARAVLRGAPLPRTYARRLTAGQAMAVAKKYLNENLAKWSDSAHVLVDQAFQVSFPCKR
jgi:hypothetical protein